MSQAHDHETQIPDEDGSGDYNNSQGEGESDFEEQERAAEAKRKSDKRFKAILFGVVAVALIGGFGYKYLSAPVAKKPVVVMAQGEQPNPVQAPIAQPPMNEPIAAPAMPDPNLGAAAVVGAMPPPEPVVGAQPAPGADPTVVMPAPGVAISEAPTIAPAGVVVVAPAAAPEGLGRGLDELGKKFDEIKGMFAKIENMRIDERLTKLEKMEARIAALEGGQPMAKAAPRPAAKVARPARVHAHVRKAPRQRVTAIADSDVLFARVISPRNSVEAAAGHSEGRGYALNAVTPGRIWVKTGEGATHTFEAGESLPDGAKILKINPDSGDVVTSKGVLRFDSK